MAIGNQLLLMLTAVAIRKQSRQQPIALWVANRSSRVLADVRNQREF
jgi:hypothetical protein